MEINIVNQTSEETWEEYLTYFVEITNQAATILKRSNESELSVIFVNAEQIHQVNKEYRNIDRPTDVISFALCDSKEEYEMMEGSLELGDIFINIEAIVTQALDYGHSIKRETCFLFTHGLLHLLGYDHGNEEEEKIMFALQDEILNDIAPKKV